MRTPRLAGGPAPRYCRRMTVADIPAGIEHRHAEAVVTVVRASRAGLATKADLDNLEARVNGRFAEFEARMLKVAVSIVLAQTALTAGLIFGLLKPFGVAP